MPYGKPGKSVERGGMPQPRIGRSAAKVAATGPVFGGGTVYKAESAGGKGTGRSGKAAGKLEGYTKYGR